MKLIDADKLMLSLEEWELNETPISTYPKQKEFTADDMQRMIWRTIRDCESAVEEQPKVKAIPVEYIEKFKKEFRAVASVKWVIDWLLEDWEKENGAKESVRNIGI